MSANELVEMANKAAEVHGVQFELNSDHYEVFKTTQISATVDGRAVVLDFKESDTNPPALRFNVTVRDPANNEQIATGNGGPDWEDAMSWVHWQEVKIYFEAS